MRITSEMNKLNILVTGGEGFIGKHLVKALLSKGHWVTSVDDRAPSPEKMISSIGYCSVTSSVEEFLEITDASFDCIFHLAATPRIGVGLKHPEAVLRNNIDSTISVLGYCRNNPKTNLIFASSSSVGWADVSINPYAQSKKICEELIKTYTSTYSINAASVRLFNVYGPGEADYGENTTLLKQCKKALSSGQPITIFGDGSVIRDFTHVFDVVRGFIDIMDEMVDDCIQPDILYELGFGAGKVSVKQIVDAFTEGQHPVVYAPAKKTDCPLTRSNRNFWPISWAPRIKVLDYISDWKASGSPND